MKKLSVGLFCNDQNAMEYLENIFMMEDCNLVGCYGVSQHFSMPARNVDIFEDPDTLVKQSDAIVMVLPPDEQFESAMRTLKNLKHLFIERPLLDNINMLDTLLSMQREADVKVQIGSGLRLNKAYSESNAQNFKPQFIETVNLSTTGDSAPVVLDLMLPDLDIVLSLVKSEVRKISTNGVIIKGSDYDIVNARIEFGNGSAASLTVNRCSGVNMHRAGFYEKGSALIVDFLNDSGLTEPESAYKLAVPKQATEKTERQYWNRSIFNTELHSFYKSIVLNQPVPIPLNDGHRALKLAYQILEKLEERGMEN